MSRRVRFARIHVVTVVAMCLVGLVGAPTLRAQDGVTVSGSVVDAEGLALPGVTVELRTGEEAFVTLAITDRAGRFALTGIEPGEYVVSVSLLGFQRLECSVSAPAGHERRRAPCERIWPPLRPAPTAACRAVRTPSVLERYSDRFPSTKFQVAAEFMGTPDLVPEKSVELNVGSTFRVARATIEGDVFYRTIDDYITVLPDASLPRRLPLSPPVVYRYINGDQARFTGFDVKAQSPVGPLVDVRGGWTYVWAEDTLFDEPVFGIPPLEQQYAVNLHGRSRAQSSCW